MDRDTELMMRFRDGDKEAFRVLFQNNHRRLYQFCWRFLGNAQEAEDAVQETFIRVYSAGASYRPRARFTTWLYTIARNLCLNRLTKIQRENKDPDQEHGPQAPLIERLPSEAHGPEQQLEEKELSRVVERAVHNLPDTLRMAVILRRYQELSYEDIAEILECSVTAVKLRLHRAKALLTAELAVYMGND